MAQLFFSSKILSIFAAGLPAGVVKLVDTLDLGSSAARRGGSTPFARTAEVSIATIHKAL